MAKKLVRRMGLMLVVASLLIAQSPLRAEEDSPELAVGAREILNRIEDGSSSTGDKAIVKSIWKKFKDAKIWKSCYNVGDKTGEWCNNHKKLCMGTIGAAAATGIAFAAWKLYEKGKVAKAKGMSQNNAQLLRLRNIEAQLDSPGLSSSDEKALNAEHDAIVGNMVAEHFKDKTFVETFQEAFSAAIAGA